MSDAVIVALIAGAVSLAGSVISMIVSSRNAKAQNDLTLYRIGKLEDKVTKHNNLVERMYEIEKRADVFDEKIDGISHRLENTEGK